MRKNKPHSAVHDKLVEVLKVLVWFFPGLNTNVVVFLLEGQSHSVREFVEAAFAVVDLPWQKLVKHDPAFDRPTEPARLVGCSDKIRKILGWKAAGTFRELVHEMVETEIDAIDSRD